MVSLALAQATEGYWLYLTQGGTGGNLAIHIYKIHLAALQDVLHRIRGTWNATHSQQKSEFPWPREKSKRAVKTEEISILVGIPSSSVPP